MARDNGDGTLTTDLQGCARCHGHGHRALTFRPLTHPYVEDSGLVMTHWAPCPTNGEPILLTAKPGPPDCSVAA